MRTTLTVPVPQPALVESAAWAKRFEPKNVFGSLPSIAGEVD